MLCAAKLTDDSKSPRRLRWTRRDPALRPTKLHPNPTISSCFTSERSARDETLKQDAQTIKPKLLYMIEHEVVEYCPNFPRQSEMHTLYLLAPMAIANRRETVRMTDAIVICELQLWTPTRNSHGWALFVEEIEPGWYDPLLDPNSCPAWVFLRADDGERGLNSRMNKHSRFTADTAAWAWSFSGFTAQTAWSDQWESVGER